MRAKKYLRNLGKGNFSVYMLPLEIQVNGNWGIVGGDSNALEKNELEEH